MLELLSRRSSTTPAIVESKELDSTIASFSFENALSFNVVDAPSFAVMVDQCIQFGQQNPRRKYKIPTQRRISGPLLGSAYEDTAASVQPIMDRAKKYGGASDGWSDVQRRPITNLLMLVTRECAVLLKSVDTTDHMRYMRSRALGWMRAVADVSSGSLAEEAASAVVTEQGSCPGVVTSAGEQSGDRAGPRASRGAHCGGCRARSLLPVRRFSWSGDSEHRPRGGESLVTAAAACRGGPGPGPRTGRGVDRAS